MHGWGIRVEATDRRSWIEYIVAALDAARFGRRNRRSAGACRRRQIRKRAARLSKICFGLCSIPRSFCSIIERAVLKTGKITIGRVVSEGRLHRGIYAGCTLGELLQHACAEPPQRRANDISVIHLFLTGGMSQMDTFDPKPNAKAEFRSKFKSIPTTVPGVHVTEHLPSVRQACRTNTRSSAA